jgi:amidohydrolase
MNEIESWLEESRERLIQTRRYLHQHPELSNQEVETQSFLKEQLKQLGPDQLIELANTGLLAVFEGEQEGPTILVRTDIDALPIEEANEEMEYKSENEGVAHKCGHDGHMTMALGLSKWIHKKGLKKGQLLVLFQPAEENAAGAKAVLEDENFTFQPDYVFALHNVPSFPSGSIVLRKKTFSASVRSIAIKFKGKTAHAAEPEQGICPDMAISKLLAFANAYTLNDPSKDSFRLITPIYVRLGQKAYGTLPAKGEIHFTMRTWTPKEMKKLVKDLEYEIEELAVNEKLDVDYDYLEVFPAVMNNDGAVEYCKKAADALGFEVIEKETPFKWGEDFGAFTQEFKGMMFGLGSGKDQAALHNDRFDFPDEILPNGIKMYDKIVELINNDA